MWSSSFIGIIGPAMKPSAKMRMGKDRKSTRLNSSHLVISYAVFCLKKKKEHRLSVMDIELSNAVRTDKDEDAHKDREQPDSMEPILKEAHDDILNQSL